MDEILLGTTYATMRHHCLLVFTGESAFQGFLGGAGFRSSTVLFSFFGRDLKQMEEDPKSCLLSHSLKFRFGAEGHLLSLVAPFYFFGSSLPAFTDFILVLVAYKHVWTSSGLVTWPYFVGNTILVAYAHVCLFLFSGLVTWPYFVGNTILVAYNNIWDFFWPVYSGSRQRNSLLTWPLHGSGG